MAADGTGKFGSCCEDLKDVLESDEFEPLIAADDDGILYMSIGLVDAEEEDEPNMVDHPVFFCPFCGTKLQTPEEVDAKAGASQLSGRSRRHRYEDRSTDGRHVQVRAGDARAHGAVGRRRPGRRAGHRGRVHRASRPCAGDLGAAPRRDRGDAAATPARRASSSRAALPRSMPTTSRCWPSARWTSTSHGCGDHRQRAGGRRGRARRRHATMPPGSRPLRPWSS